MNFKTIYLKWLIEHIDHYIFVSDEAKELKQKLLGLVNLTSQNVEMLSGYYNRFVELFDNDPFRVHLGIFNKEKGIWTEDIEYYLEENEYGFKLPLQFFSEYGLSAKCTILDSSETKKEEINGYYKSLNEEVDRASQRIYMKMKGGSFANHYIKYIILFLCLGYVIYSLWFYRGEILHFDVKNNTHLWMAITLVISILLIIFGLLDVPKFIRTTHIKGILRKYKHSEIDMIRIGECIDATCSDLRKCYSYKAGGGR